MLKGVADAAKANNMTVGATATFKPTEIDLSAQLASLKNADVDLVVLGTIVRQTVTAYTGARQMGWNVNMITSIPGRNQTILAIAASTKANLDGLWGISQWRIHDKATDLASAKAWIEAYEAKFKKPATMEAMVSYSVTEWTALALEAAGKDLTVEKFTKALREIKYTDKFGNPTQSVAEGITPIRRPWPWIRSRAASGSRSATGSPPSSRAILRRAPVRPRNREVFDSFSGAAR